MIAATNVLTCSLVSARFPRPSSLLGCPQWHWISASTSGMKLVGIMLPPPLTHPHICNPVQKRISQILPSMHVPYTSVRCKQCGLEDINSPLGFLRHLEAIMNLKPGGLATFGVVCSSWTRINGILACISCRQALQNIIPANAATKPFPAVHTSGRSPTNPLGDEILGCAHSIMNCFFCFCL